MTISPNEHVLIEAQLHEVTDAENELQSFIEEENCLHVKLSRRSWDIITASIGYIKEAKEWDGDLDEQ